MRTIEELALANELMKWAYVKKLTLHPDSEDLSAILEQHPKLVVAMNHGPALGALAAAIALMHAYLRSGGEERVPFALTWRGYYQAPVLKQFFTMLTQVDRALSFNDVLRLMRASRYTDCLIMPEGENCSFGDGLNVQPFLSPRFIELSLRSRAPLLLCLHQGAESWARSVRIPPWLLGVGRLLPRNMEQRLRDSRMLSIPRFPRKLSNLNVMFRLYHPRLLEKDLSDDASIRTRQLWQEAWQIHAVMQSHIEKMAQATAPSLHGNDYELHSGG
ncbi:hypothetical protein [Hahella sp. HN01]|uniref:hypothetical protein n=1 Tax=Hahella sp. HN01 TaxID=2847262 RepID=UPI001C1ED0DF|nr:hypothetical protein [Hahella sp. HN01]MBU6950473.1 hypothetical protein [Hahella sp. HN01]